LASLKLAAYPESERVAKVLVVLSDGEDNSSHRSLKQAIADAEGTGVTVYTVSTTEHLRPETDADNILQVLAERTGGESIFSGDMHMLDKSLDRLRELIRSRYLVVYKPADFVPNGKFRAIRLTAGKKGEHLQVHVRKGYTARLEAETN
jgi:Ca-activated chloride channel homolog